MNLKWYFINLKKKNNYIYNYLNQPEYFKKKNFELNYNIIYYILKVLYNYIDSIKLINNEIIINIKNNNNLQLLVNFFKNNYKLQLKELIDITTVDYFLKKKRFEITYFFLSIKYKLRIRLKLVCNEQDVIQSITNLYSSAYWLERENWDMFGIFFTNHSDLRRILTDYGFDGFPFRKDFPLSGYIELRYDDEKKIVVYEKLEMMQEFRYFEFTSPWDWEKK